MGIGLLGCRPADWDSGRDVLRQFIAALTLVDRSHRLEISVLLPPGAPALM